MSNNHLALLADRLINVPLLIDPGKASIIYGVLQGRISLDVSLDPAQAAYAAQMPDASGFIGTRAMSENGRPQLARRAGGVAIIDVIGSLVNRGAWVGASSGLTSYEGIGAQIDEAAADPKTTAIILDLNSPGGEAGGMFMVAAKVRAAAAVKPVIAVVNDMAASAGYGIACGATEIVISPTSFVGSIGVVMVHFDHSAEMEKKGVAATIFQAGANKSDGHPFGPIPEGVKKSIQLKIDTFYARFLETVAEGRGARLTAEAARATEAQVFVGQQAIDMGLADRIASFDQVLTELQTAQTGPKTAPAGARMETEPMSEEQIAAARAEGQTAATARIGAILQSDEAKGRATLANHFAFNTDMSADAAKAALAVSAKEVVAAPEAAIELPGQRADAEMGPGAEANRPSGADAAQTVASEGWKSSISDYNKRCGG
jgi:capsid assembly protease